MSSPSLLLKHILTSRMQTPVFSQPIQPAMFSFVQDGKPRAPPPQSPELPIWSWWSFTAIRNPFSGTSSRKKKVNETPSSAKQEKQNRQLNDHSEDDGDNDEGEGGGGGALVGNVIAGLAVVSQSENRENCKKRLWLAPSGASQACMCVCFFCHFSWRISNFLVSNRGVVAISVGIDDSVGWQSERLTTCLLV